MDSTIATVKRRIRFKADEDAYIRAAYPYGVLSDMALHLGREERSIVSRAHTLGVKKLNKRMRVSTAWTPETKEMLSLMFSELSSYELAEFFGLTVHQVMDEGSRQGLRKSPEFLKRIQQAAADKAPKFKKGEKPWNVGIDDPSHPWHKRGFYVGLHPRSVPVGTIRERVRQNGKLIVTYRYIKVGMPSSWRALHQWKWEEHHGKPVPDGHSVVFSDGNHDNYEPSNLLCLTFEELSMCSTKNLPYQALPLVKRQRALGKAIAAREKAQKTQTTTRDKA